ncbi:hypothetical protein EIK77_003965 [Talaromyces pinophilus]|nr:hypothetical protein EIK77_003965 [Talaromyces pinophilus]
MKFKHRVTAADFDESKGQWDLQIENHEGHLFTEHCNILISATGFLSRWKWPQIDGLHSFQGGAPVMHSASWDEEYDFTGKRIAVIGNGSSGIQIVPEMAKVGSKVVNFARSGTWILAGLGNRMIDGRANYIYSEEEKHRFREDIDALKAYRKEIQQQSFASFSIFVKDSEMQTQAVDATKKLMLTKLNNYDDLAAKLIPNWPIGCRRATPGLDYLQALTQPHVSLVQEPIQRVTEHGITTVDGLSREFDVIICATGFDVSYRPGFPLRGRDGVDLAEKWKEAATTTTTTTAAAAAAAAETGPLAYLSICVPGFPNYFMFTGPNAPVGHGALMAGLGWTAEYIAKWIVKLAEEDIKWVEVKEDATQEFNAYADQIMQTLVWSSPCKSWYKNSNNDDDNHNNAEGRVTALWAGSGLGFREMVSSLRPEDFVIRYHSSNRFRFMGNGRVKQEFQPGADLAWFMD